MIAQQTQGDNRARRAVLEPVAVYAAIMAVAKALSLAGPTGRVVLENALPLAFVFVPLLILDRTRRDAARYGLTAAGWRRDVFTALGATLALIPFYVAAVHLIPAIVLGREPGVHLDWDIARRALLQVAVVAFPEEVFFRAYMQTRLSDRFARRRRVLGADLSVPAVILTSLLLAAGHMLIQPHPARLLVFFPSLVFCWMRERTGSILASCLFHGAANVAVLVLFG